VGSSPDCVKIKIIKLVFVASLLSMYYQGNPPAVVVLVYIGVKDVDVVSSES
jgi:hypothetical protein